MRKIIIFGNSGAGKSTLAVKLSALGLAHLDLDTLAWLDITPPSRKPLNETYTAIKKFVDQHQQWVIEGCYADLLEMVKPFATEAIFINLPIELCQDNAINRPWEPHKYPSQKAQDDNLPMLLDWIARYNVRDDTLSYSAHLALFESFDGKKVEITTRENW